MPTDSIFIALKELEESLWISKTRFDLDYMNRILSKDFLELGRSGRIYNRNDILALNPQEINIYLPLQDFAIRNISENVVLVTYLSKVKYEKMELTNRSSIWSKNGQDWQLRFHQGTPVE